MTVEAERTTVPTWVRYGGLAAIIASILEVFTTLFIEVVFPEALVPGTRDALLAADLVITYLILGIIGVAAVYVRYNDSFGWVGNLGLLSITVGALIGIGSILLIGLTAGNLLNFILVFGGAGLLAIGLWRTPTIPRSAAILMGLSPVAALVGIVGFSLAPESLLTLGAFLVLNIVWGGSWIILGYHLWTDSTARSKRD